LYAEARKNTGYLKTFLMAMTGINWGRVILGGLVAGMLINVVEFLLNGVVLAKDWEAAMLVLGRPPIFGSRIAVFFIWSFLLWGFLIGIFAVWLYAAILPRYGAGPKTAIYVGSFVWGLGYLLTSVTPFLLNLYPRRIFGIGLSVGLLEVLLATLIGACLYRERKGS
jgi:hypothetical protein